jgi:hypothetical protein
MSDKVRQSIAIAGAALLAMAFAGTLPAWAGDNQPATSQQAQQQQQFAAMQARMQAMHAIMIQIQQTKDPATRQQLMNQEFQLMREQMKDMGMMNGMMMGYGATGHGMMGGGMMGGGMTGGGRMQPGTPKG